MVSTPHMLSRARVLLTSAIMSAFLFVVVWQSLSAQGVEPTPPDLSSSSKSVSDSEAQPGDLLSYTIVISNGGTDPATSVIMSDTLPNGLSLITDSVSVTGGGVYTVGVNALSWAGAVNNGTAVELSFDAQLTDTLTNGTWITNTVNITGTGALISRSASTQIVTGTVNGDAGTIYMPAWFNPYPMPPLPVLQPVSGPDANNEWTVNWTVPDDTWIDGYTLQESHDPDFATATSIDATTTSHDFAHPASHMNTYYYRVRAYGPGGVSEWSEVREITGNYRDDFKSDTTGWTIRKEDLDDTENYSRYQNNHFVMEIDGRWDFAIAGPLAKAPDAPFAIETSVRLESADNLNSYGIVWGADWNGEQCSRDREHTNNCYNHYYRLNIIWFGGSDVMHFQLKRIDRHDPMGNNGRGPSLIPFSEVHVNSPSAGYQVWRVEHHANGDIKLFVNGDQFGSVNDSTYLGDPYFGTFASSDEYLGSEPWFDWYSVTALQD